MSGVYIKGLKMPERCVDCPLCYDGMDCVALDESLEVLEVVDDFDRYDSRSSNCPLVAVPDHGRLVDADALKEKAHYDDFDNAVVDVDDIDAAPTVIGADRSE